METYPSSLDRAGESRAGDLKISGDCSEEVRRVLVAALQVYLAPGTPSEWAAKTYEPERVGPGKSGNP